jgi:hypothetical protein
MPRSGEQLDPGPYAGPGRPPFPSHGRQTPLRALIRALARQAAAASLREACAGVTGGRVPPLGATEAADG